MVERSITDEEIALIKAMNARGMKNKDIQFYFNRPERAVNSGRISGICNGTYSNSASIEMASPGLLDAYLAENAPALSKPAAPERLADDDPVSPGNILALFGKSGGQWRLKAGESDEHECKEGFSLAHPGKWLRAVAALSNNRGGYILFGVHDNDDKKEGGVDLSHAVVGLKTSEFSDADVVKITQALTSTFDPTPRIRKAVASVAGMSVGVLYVDAHPSRPIIATKASQDIKEGDIFYRYPAQARRIKYSDLRALLDARDAEARRELLPMVERLIALGPKNTLIANLEAGALEDGRRVIRLDKEDVKSLQFIKEGQFSEKDGAPTIRLLGDFEAAVSVENVVTEHITKGDVIPAFLSQSSVSDPKQYIRLLVESTQDIWMPIFFFARQAGMSNSDFCEFIMGLAAKKSRRNWFCDRIQGKHPAYARAVGASVVPWEAIKSGKIPELKDRADASSVANAVRGLDEKPPLDMSDMLRILASAIDIANNSYDPSPVMSSIRRALCRIDEMYFSES